MTFETTQKRLSGIGVVYLLEAAHSAPKIRADLKQIKTCGFNTVTLWPPITWWDDPARAAPRFDTLRLALDVCAKLELGAILEIVGQNPAYELVPNFQLKKEFLTVDEVGFSNRVNFNHPEVKNITRENLCAVVAAIKDCPALIAYDLWNETYFSSKDQWTLGLFQTWLREKYGDVRSLNRAWETTFTAFDQISFDQTFFGASLWATMTPMLDWERFRVENLAAILREWAGIVRKLDPDRLIMADNGECTVFAKSVKGGHNDWNVAAAVDVFGTTYYPRSSCGHYLNRADRILCDEDFWVLECALNATRSAAAGKPWVVSELQSHVKNAMTPETYVTGEHVSLWCWQALALGCRSVTFWKWQPFLRGRQTAGRGLVRLDGGSTDRCVAASDAAMTYNRHRDVFESIQPAHSEIGILFQPAMPAWLAHTPSADPGYYQQSLVGWSKLIWEKGWTFDYVPVDALDGRDLSGYRMIVAPSTMIIDPPALAALRCYVESGGVLIADGRFALMSENNIAYTNVPGSDADAFMGYREIDVRPARGTDTFILFDQKNIPLRGLFKVIAEPGDKAGIAAQFDDGSPAVVRHDYGQGTALYCAFDLGRAYAEGFDSAYTELFAGLTQPWQNRFLLNVRDNARLVSRHVHHIPQGMLVFIINYGKAVDIEFAINTQRCVRLPVMIKGDVPSVTFDGQGIKIAKSMIDKEICLMILPDERT